MKASLYEFLFQFKMFFLTQFQFKMLKIIKSLLLFYFLIMEKFSFLAVSIWRKEIASAPKSIICVTLLCNSTMNIFCSLVDLHLTTLGFLGSSTNFEVLVLLQWITIFLIHRLKLFMALLALNCLFEVLCFWVMSLSTTHRT